MRLNDPIRYGWLKPGVVITRRYLDKDGYVMLHVDIHYIVGKCRVAEHRLVMMEKLGRKLRKGEIVHHDKVRRRTYNKPSNLVLMSASEHAVMHNRERIVSEKTRAKMRSRMRGNKHLLGHVHTAATREKMRLSHTGVSRGPHSIETRRKIGEASRRHKHTAAQRAKISAGLRRFHS